MYQIISSFSSLLAAYKLACRCKQYSQHILKFGFDLEKNLEQLSLELTTQRYWPSPYVYFTVTDPKERHIAAPAFRDRVVHHSLVTQIEPLFEKQFITDSYACRKNKGTHFGSRRIKKFLQAARSVYGTNKPIYCLRMDISKFFVHIDWDILLAIIFRTVNCPKTEQLISRIVTHHRIYKYQTVPPFSVVSSYHRTGLPIGNLTSQLFANVYMNELDRYVKKSLHIRWYGRYMDDFLIIHSDRKYLWQQQKAIELFSDNTLKLPLSKHKVVLAPVDQGVPFVGYRIFYDHILVRNSTLLHIERKLRKRRNDFIQGRLTTETLQATKSSLLGHFSHAQTWGLRKKLALWK
ncbi:MAG: RNA-dependent DNA polymerase [Candidatus Pacebacteria bacterium CG_4_10_14_0_8_um_filter_43_12]|nr:MAG: RNA-dependent DNA polymerase [Candidatus Pacebacteria bacterium CG10_big_fil_rev_8_21_14_0_10_44_11]PIY79170.1 MAG: RNA-dependent DNA polymerase [Candidatus Pacebacteria bacterium CG_4_10_14_0_8_um_filter_43_12]